MSDHEHKSFLHTAAEFGAIAAGVGAILNYDKLGRIENAIRDAEFNRQLERDRPAAEARLQRAREQAQEERQRANREYLARVANEDNWFAPPEPEAPPIICAPPRRA